MDCERCGDELPGTEVVDGEPWWWDGDVITCASCGSTSTISCDGEEPAYVGSWTCKHGVDDETPCPSCDAEDEAAPPPASEAGGGETEGAR